MRPLSDKMVAEIESKNMTKEAPILVRLFKQESELEVWKQDRSGRYALLKTYPICRWSGELGPKIKEGDRQAPEGFYTITPGQMNPNSSYYLAFNMGYPNAFDRAHGRTGAELMVHGDCSSRGCYAMTDEQIAEIYALARDAFFGGQRAFQVQAYPFRMTPINMAKHRTNPNMPFWKMLKEGYDHFEVTHLAPKVDVCEKRYVFDAEAPSSAFNPAGKCPAIEVPQDVAQAVAHKQKKDNYEIAQLIARGTPVAPIRTNTDGGMHPVFLAKVQGPATLFDNDGRISGLTALTATAPAMGNNVNPPKPAHPEYAPQVATGSVPARPAPVRTAARSEAPAAAEDNPIGEKLGGMFGLASTESKPAPTRVASADPSAKPSLFSNLFASGGDKTDKSESPLDKMSRWIGLRGSSDDEDKPEPQKAKPAPRSKPAARHTVRTASHTSPGAIRPQAAAKPSHVAQAVPPAPPPKPAAAAAAAPAPAAAAPAAPAPSRGVIAGAAPVIGTGSFESRWSAAGFR